MVIVLYCGLPLGACLIKLVGSEKCNNGIDLHQLVLLDSQVRVLLQLGLNAVRELFPVEVANELLELLFV